MFIDHFEIFDHSNAMFAYKYPEEFNKMTEDRLNDSADMAKEICSFIKKIFKKIFLMTKVILTIKK